MKLRAWMSANDVKAHDFSVRMAAQLRRNYFSQKTVENWVQGRTIPQREFMNAISEITGGAVTPNDFFSMDGAA